MSELIEKKLVDIWNYLSDTKELIGISNAYDDALPAHCTTVAPPAEIPAGSRAYFDEDSQTWAIKTPVRMAVESVKVYSFLAGSGELLGSGLIAGTIPPNCTDIAPEITAPAGSVLSFDTDAREWVVKEDHRGEVVYNTQTREQLYIDTLGPYPENTTPQAPAVPFPVWSGSAWVTDADAQRKATIRTNVKHYQKLISRTARATFTLTTGRTLTADELATLAALHGYADELAGFIQTADLTDAALVLPAAEPGLLDYPYALNPTYEGE